MGSRDLCTQLHSSNSHNVFDVCEVNTGDDTFTCTKLISKDTTMEEFDTGAKRDIQRGKGRCDLIPMEDVINALSDELVTSKDMDIMNILIHIERIKNKLTNKDYDSVNQEICKAISIFLNLRRWTWYDALLELSKRYEMGADKYGEYNWQKGIPTHSYIDSGVRHLLKYGRGDTDEPHDQAFIWNMVSLTWTIRCKPEMNDLLNYSIDEK